MLWASDPPAVVVVDWKRAPDAWRQVEKSGYFPSSGGACYADWPGTIRPEHEFAHVLTDALSHGQLTEDFFWETVRQFARIDVCGWARAMHEQRRNEALVEADLEHDGRLPNGQRVRLQ